MAELFWSFLLYSFFGFLLELAFARLTRSPKRDRKCFYFLPLCPVYGLGALLILSLPAAIRLSPLLLAPAAALAATLAEYTMALFYEKIAGVPFWDYSALPLNLGGRVCLLFSALWGVLGLGLVYGVQPLLAGLVASIPPALLLPAAGFFLLDSGFTLAVLRRTKSTDALRWYRCLYNFSSSRRVS